MDPLDALRIARNEFGSRLAQVGDDQWTSPTPCGDWNVSQLVNHIMLGTRMTVQLLDGVSKDEAIAGLGDDLMADCPDPLARFDELADQAHAGFAAAGGLDGTVDHPMGEIPRPMFVGFRIGDYATHAWDLARAIGADETLDPGVVQYLWDDIQPMAATLAETGMFGDGASGQVPEDAPLQTRYLDVVGRRP